MGAVTALYFRGDRGILAHTCSPDKNIFSNEYILFVINCLLFKLKVCIKEINQLNNLKSQNNVLLGYLQRTTCVRRVPRVRGMLPTELG